MDNKINTDIKSLELIYARNKPFIIPIVVILVCIALFIKVELPLFGNLQQVLEDSKKASQELESLKKDLQVIESLDGKTLDSQLDIANNALPANKNFSAILNAVYLTAQKTGVILGEFTFQVGDLDKPDEGVSNPVITLSLSLDGDIRVINSFVEIISKTLPLSDISLVKSSNKASTVNLLFYYKPLMKNLPGKDLKIGVVSEENLSLLSELAAFNNSSSSFVETSAPSTPSGQIANPF